MTACATCQHWAKVEGRGGHWGACLSAEADIRTIPPIARVRADYGCRFWAGRAAGQKKIHELGAA